MRKNTFIILAATLLLTNCGINNKYEQKNEIPADVIGVTQDVQAVQGGTSLSQMTWRDFFTDPLLQQLIEQVLANNTDMNSARIVVEKSEASLKAAKMAVIA